MTPNVEPVKPAISPSLARILSIALALTAPLVARIKNEYAKRQLTNFLSPLQDAVKALSDADPNDGKQLTAILHRFYVVTGFGQETKAELLKILSSVPMKDERARKILIIMIGWVFDLLPVLIDEQQPNKDQVVEFLENQLRSEKGVEFVEVLISFILKDEQTAAWIAAIIVEILRGAIDSPELGKLFETLVNKDK